MLSLKSESIFGKLEKRIRKYSNQQPQQRSRKYTENLYNFSEQNESRVGANGQKIFQMDSDILFKQKRQGVKTSGLANLLVKKTENIKNQLKNSLQNKDDKEDGLEKQPQYEQTYRDSYQFSINEDNTKNTEWDIDEDEDQYVDTLEVKPKQHIFITPETQADESEFYEDFDFQLDVSCQKITSQDKFSYNDNNNIEDDEEDYFSDFDF